MSIEKTSVGSPNDAILDNEIVVLPNYLNSYEAIGIDKL